MLTGKWYIGMHSTSNIDDGYMGSGRILTASIKKHGVENFKKEIVEFLESRDLLINREKELVTPEVITDSKCMNLMIGGKGGFISKEQQKYRSQCAGLKFHESRKNNPDIDINWKQKISESNKLSYKLGKSIPHGGGHNKGIPMSDVDKQKISDTLKGKGVGINNSQYGTCWITKDGLNKKIKKEDLNMWLDQFWVKGLFVSDETKAKLSEKAKIQWKRKWE